MPGLLMPITDESPLTPALLAIRMSRQAGCKTDPNPGKWYSKQRGRTQLLDEQYASSVCRQCPVRTLCAGWAFEMEDFGVWAGFTTPDRKRLRRDAPELVGELVMIVQALVNLSNGTGGRLRAGTSGEVPDALAAIYIRKGFATAVTPAGLAARATEILSEFDEAKPTGKRTPWSFAKEDEPKQVVEDIETDWGTGEADQVTIDVDVSEADEK